MVTRMRGSTQSKACSRIAADTASRSELRHVQALDAVGETQEAMKRLMRLRARPRRDGVRVDPDSVDYVGMTGVLYARLGDRARAMTVADSLAARHRPF